MLTSSVEEEYFSYVHVGFVDFFGRVGTKKLFQISLLGVCPSIKENILSNLFFYSCGVEKDILCDIVAAEMGIEPEEVFWDLLDLRDSGTILIDEDIVTGVFDGEQ